ncbi:unnamed protein product [Phytophthora fragariaefolia]|uniref:Unnamed protein product n=1 Tax=Phytophthora fragariaefolia TaxID=1490495 RepID=A0A9W7CNV3_9STRA|nr:unnamed protein product [Phytophthora fragariaefolia]
MEAIAEETDAEEKTKPPPPPPPPPSSLLLDAHESFEAIEAATDADDVKQESENTASNAYKVLLWTYRLQASLQSAVQYALFAKTSEDGCFIQIAPRFGRWSTVGGTCWTGADDGPCGCWLFVEFTAWRRRTSRPLAGCLARTRRRAIGALR